MPPADLLALAREEVRGYGVELIEDRGRRDRARLHARARRRRLVDSATAAAHDRRRRRAARHPRRARALGPRLPALPVLPRLGGARPADRRPRNRPGSVDHAQLLRQWSDDVVFFSHSHALTAEERAALDARGIAVVEGPVTRFSVVDDRLHGVELDDGRVIPRAAVFMRPSLHPHRDGLIESLGCEVGDDGFVRVDADRPDERPRRLGGRQRQQPTRTGDHRRRRRIRRRDRDQHRPRPRGRSKRPSARRRRKRRAGIAQ